MLLLSSTFAELCAGKDEEGSGLLSKITLVAATSGGSLGVGK
jgi:hypothetical protein